MQSLSRVNMKNQTQMTQAEDPYLSNVQFPHKKIFTKRKVLKQIIIAKPEVEDTY